jgi:hypothetical protein
VSAGMNSFLDDLTLLGKLIKHSDINSESIFQFTNSILNRSLRMFFGRKPGKRFSLPDTLFWYLSTVIKKKSAIIGRAIIETILNWFEDIILQSTPFLGPIAAALSVGLFDESLAR